VDCSRAIYEQDLKKVAISLKIVAVLEPSEKSCWFSEEKRHFSEKKKWFVTARADVACGSQAREAEAQGGHRPKSR
jgi:hypothetical protein